MSLSYVLTFTTVPSILLTAVRRNQILLSHLQAPSYLTQKCLPSRGLSLERNITELPWSKPKGLRFVKRFMAGQIFFSIFFKGLLELI